MIKCPNCGNEKEVLIRLPAIVVKPTAAGEATFTRQGYKSNGDPDNICFECLKYEANENL